MNQQKIETRFGIIVGIIVLAAASRFISPLNFNPIGAISLFGAAYFSKKIWAFVVPLLSLWISSLILDNVVYAQYYDGFQWFSNPFVYLGFALTVIVGFLALKKINLSRIFGAALSGTVVFFIVSNFGSWLEMPILYTRDLNGLTAAYAAGLPFLQNSLIGNLLYCGLLFGSFEWVKISFPSIVLVKK